MTTTCLKCNETKPSESAYSVHGLHRRVCRACLAHMSRKYGKDDASRVLSNVKDYCRKHGLGEGMLWKRQDVETLLEAVELPPELVENLRPGERLRYRILRVDETKPFIPSNAVAKVYGTLPPPSE